MKKENIILREEIKKLQLENYKLLKVNGILNLGKDLTDDSKQRLAEGFDKCKSKQQVKELYSKVINTIKESKKPSLNKLVMKENKGFNSFTQPNIPSEERVVLTEDQKRINHLMGLSSEDDMYFED